MKYELKAIFRNRLMMVSILIFVMTAMILFVGIEHDLVDHDTLRNENKRTCEYEMITLQRNVEDWEENWDYYMEAMGTTEEARTVLKALRAYDEYKLEDDEALLEIYDEENWWTDENNAYMHRAMLINWLADMAVTAWPEEGYETPEVYFAEEIEEFQDMLQLDELGFQLEDLTDSPFLSRNDHLEMVSTYLEKRNELEMLFKMYKSTDEMNNYTGKPYNFLYRVFRYYSYPQIIMGVILILFPCFYCVSCRNDESRRLQELRPEKRNRIAGHYYGSVLVAMGIVVVGFLLIPMIVLGIQNGWGGLTNPMRVDPANFTSWTPYEHNEMRSTAGISTAYGDFKNSCGRAYELKIITLGRFLLMTLPIALLQMVFLTLTGFCIGYIGKKKGAAIFAGVIAVGIYLASQFAGAGMKWNPFAVQSAWEIVEGGANMTALNAIVVLAVADLLLAGIIFIYNRKRDYC